MTQQEAIDRAEKLQTSKETADMLRHMAELVKFDVDKVTLLVASQQLDQYRQLTADLAGIV